MADAKSYQKTPQDKVVILNVRAWEKQLFVAPNWVDLRVGFFLSLTKALADDDIAGLGETLVSDPPASRYWIGVKTNDSGLPGNCFIGFSNAGVGGDSQLLSSDIGLGTTNANYWRPASSVNNNTAASVWDGGVLRAQAPDGVQQHFPQSEAGAGGYAVLLGLQLLRDNAQSRTVRVNIKSSGHSADMLYSNTPTQDVLLNALQAWPPSLQMGPLTLSAVPDCLYFYWPFRNSRLRIHAYGVVKAK